MKVVANETVMGHLTKGKEYTVLGFTGSRFEVEDDQGYMNSFWKSRFEPVVNKQEDLLTALLSGKYIAKKDGQGYYRLVDDDGDQISLEDVDVDSLEVIDKVNACPFCNGDFITTEPTEGVKDFCCLCQNCGSAGPVEATVKKAVEAWNKRGDK